jgi:hypothetical protein
MAVADLIDLLILTTKILLNLYIYFLKKRNKFDNIFILFDNY